MNKDNIFRIVYVLLNFIITVTISSCFHGDKSNSNVVTFPGNILIFLSPEEQKEIKFEIKSSSNINREVNMIIESIELSSNIKITVHNQSTLLKEVLVDDNVPIITSLPSQNSIDQILSITVLNLSSDEKSKFNLNLVESSYNQGTINIPYTIDLTENSQFSGQVGSQSFYSLKLPEKGAYNIGMFFEEDTRLQMTANDHLDSNASIGVSCANYDFPDFDCTIKGIFTNFDDIPTIVVEIKSLHQPKGVYAGEFLISTQRVRGEIDYQLPLDEVHSMGFSEKVDSSHYQIETSSEGIYHIFLSAIEIDIDLAVLVNSLSENANYELLNQTSEPICIGNNITGLDCEYLLSGDSKFDIEVIRYNVDSNLPFEFDIEVVSP